MRSQEFASQVVYVHGKFDIDEDGQVDNMDYPKIFKALIDGGYKGYICSEFEGNRRMNDAGGAMRLSMSVSITS